MKHTLVIHPEDQSTNFLSKIYEGKDWKVIRTDITDKELQNIIKEHDRIIMLGHGTPYGLIGFGRMLVNSNHVYLLKNKECVA